MTTANLAAIDTALKARAAEDFDERLKALEGLAEQESQLPALPRIAPIRSDKRSDRQEMNGATNHAEHQQPNRDPGEARQEQTGPIHPGSQTPATTDPDDDEGWR
jgi:hypothetical protein